MFIFTNPNPTKKLVGDCTIRAISIFLQKSWDDIYMDLAILGLCMGDMPSSNGVWSTYLRQNGGARRILPNDCPFCYTVKDFCRENPIGIFLLTTGSHVVTVIDGNYYDTWDSGDEIIINYWVKGETEDGIL